MKKIVKQYGNSAVIIFSPEDLQVYQISVGDVVEIAGIKKVGRIRELKKEEKK